jgi:membrane-associated phospholipid phosphatase
MTQPTDYRTLFVRSLKAIGVGVVVITLSYLFIDRPVATFVFDNHISDAFLRWLTYPPPEVQAWTPAVLVALMIRAAFGPLRRWERTLFAAGVGVIVADQFRESLSYAFGRTWPETWIDDNPSFIGDGVFGFHLFHGGEGYASFPSGHTARTLAAVTPFWIAYPKSRWACAAATAAVAIGLIGMNYHFVSDVIAGGVVGGIVGAYATRLSGAAREPASY